MKKRTTIVAAALAASIFSGATSIAAEQPALENPTSVTKASPETEATSTTDVADTADTTATADTADTTATGDTADPTEPDRMELDPDKGIWDKNGASSERGNYGSFGRFTGLNQLENYLNSNHFKTISTIVSVIAGVITVGSQLAALIISVSPEAKAQVEQFMKRFN